MQTVKNRVLPAQQTGLLILILLLVFSNLAISAPEKVADFAGRGCSAPLWSPDNRFIAYTTIDLDSLFVVEPAESKMKQSLYRVANAAGIGRRFVFVPGEERLAYRVMIGAIPSHPDRVVAVSFYSFDPSVLTDNDGQIIGPYRIENQLFYRKSLAQPLLALDGTERKDGAFILDGKLVVRNQTGAAVFNSDGLAVVEGFEISPDGQWVAAVFSTDGNRAVRLIQVSDGAEFDLGRGRWPAWSGNSNRVVFVRDKSEVRFAELIVYDVQLGQSRSVTGVNQFWPDEPALNSDGSMVAFVHDGEIFITEVTGF